LIRALTFEEVRHAGQCVAYGTGILDLAHLPDEHCLVEDVVNAAKVMALTTMELLGVEISKTAKASR
jgi:succinyl-diaminopimelate desuccinylase